MRVSAGSIFHARAPTPNRVITTCFCALHVNDIFCQVVERAKQSCPGNVYHASIDPAIPPTPSDLLIKLRRSIPFLLRFRRRRIGPPAWTSPAMSVERVGCFRDCKRRIVPQAEQWRWLQVCRDGRTWRTIGAIVLNTNASRRGSQRLLATTAERGLAGPTKTKLRK